MSEIGLISKKIPRAVYYMGIFEPIRSIARFVFGLNGGASVKVFENKFSQLVKSKHAIAVSHARIGMYYAIKSLKIQGEFEVLMTPITVPDMLNMIRLCGGKPILVDFMAGTFYVDINSLKKKISDKTKVIIITHLTGYSEDIAEIYQIAKELGITLIQDSTQNINSKINNKPLTDFSDISIYALCDLKVIHTHRGGMICCNNSELFKNIESLVRLEETKPSRSYFLKFILEDLVATTVLNPWLFTFIFYPIFAIVKRVDFEIIANISGGKGFRFLGIDWLADFMGGDGNFERNGVPGSMKYQYTELQAKIGLRSMDKVEEWDRRRIENARLFIQTANEKTRGHLLPERKGAENVYWKMPVLCNDYKKLQDYLFRHGIDSALSLLPSLSNESFMSSQLGPAPVAEWMRRSTLFIPLHHYLGSEDILRISRCVNNYFLTND